MDDYEGTNYAFRYFDKKVINDAKQRQLEIVKRSLDSKFFTFIDVEYDPDLHGEHEIITDPGLPVGPKAKPLDLGIRDD